MEIHDIAYLWRSPTCFVLINYGKQEIKSDISEKIDVVKICRGN